MLATIELTDGMSVSFVTVIDVPVKLAKELPAVSVNSFAVTEEFVYAT